MAKHMIVNRTDILFNNGVPVEYKHILCSHSNSDAAVINKRLWVVWCDETTFFRLTYIVDGEKFSQEFSADSLDGAIDAFNDL